MGNAAPVAEEGDEYAEFDGIETLGYRVLGVQPGSPASQAGLVSFFDFLVGANGKILLGSGEGLEEGEEYDDVDFPALLQEYKGNVVELLVWNIKAQEKRIVELIPHDEWGGAGLLGVTIKLDNYGGADERLIRVLDVEEGSPAAVAGLVKEKDFLLGTTSHNFGDYAVLAAVLEESIDEVVEVYVYNTETDIVRIIALVPSLTWGGSGLLGAEVGSGYLHCLPSSCRSTVGKSVERKVRWTNGAEGGSSTRVEMEPHLEMEGEGECRAYPQSTSKQPHELGTREASPDLRFAGDPEANGHPSESSTKMASAVCDEAPAAEVDANAGETPLPDPPKMHY
mmetsp:Transcript_62621/g.180106  ORF Transcript_62621/g.180106 Transcript_62621/m.180106 type:complete len:339 (-) Transcript_62621:116-1132(-)